MEIQVLNVHGEVHTRFLLSERVSRQVVLFGAPHISEILVRVGQRETEHCTDKIRRFGYR